MKTTTTNKRTYKLLLSISVWLTVCACVNSAQVVYAIEDQATQMLLNLHMELATASAIGFISVFTVCVCVCVQILWITKFRVCVCVFFCVPKNYLTISLYG